MATEVLTAPPALPTYQQAAESKYDRKYEDMRICRVRSADNKLS